MDRIEAIKVLNRFPVNYTGMKIDEANRIDEALAMATRALRPVSREQVEQMRGEWQVCFEDWRKQMAGDQCSKCGFQHYGTSINLYKFCPNCGAPMTDEAVDILLKRLEVLHEIPPTT